MIRSFKGKWAGQVFTRQRCRRLFVEIQRAAHRKLAIIDAAGAIPDLRLPPGNLLEKLSGDRKLPRQQDSSKEEFSASTFSLETVGGL